ncbi:adenylate kinase [Halobacteriovorax marinus]|uniref:Adenylate kinase n=1 Tax=Halobacteriovorax marinus (strain ATCC BAA-682 / DSM 15412 / SJ) TaxID=862908 RepID=E1X0K1_HALMS|nr:adenylate kinase [Halobacteriovorax marinus]ATH09289.1 adenylate kinase [Halobacteriovorax marinus]CBW28027.1 putative adenylate kinase (ATP-AMP transphosphorylase) [Halobacteriovorax marinus SJ]
MKPQLILLGAPGTGKGTQAKKIVENLGYSHVSTGDLLRNEIAKDSELGKKVKGIIDRGDLVNDQVVLELLNANCDIENSAYIFDGFPRNIEQAQLLEEHVLKGADSKAIYFNIDLEVLVERISNRRIAPKSGEIYNLLSRPPKVEGKCDVSGEDLIHRKDDNAETVRNRLEVFKNTIAPILDYYESKGVLVSIDASRSADEVYGLVVEAVNK